MDVDPAQEDEASALPKARGLGAGAALWHDEASNTQKIYVDRQFFASYEDQVQALTDSQNRVYWQFVVLHDRGANRRIMF